MTFSEKSIKQKNIIEKRKQKKNLDIPFPIIRIKDRGYVSLKDFYYSNKRNEKYVVRLKKQDLKTLLAKEIDPNIRRKLCIIIWNQWKKIRKRNT